MFEGVELLNFIEQADFVTVNDYEVKMLQDKTGKNIEELARRTRALIVTLGAQGSMIYAGGKVINIPAVPPIEVLDPTGCGDAYRAGLLYGLMNELDWESTGRIASLMGAIKIEHHGTQNHSLDMAEFKQRFHENFGFSF